MGARGVAEGSAMIEHLRWTGLLILVLVGAGCAMTMTLRELDTQEPRITRQVTGESAAIAECVQNYAEDHAGLGGIGYETRTREGTTHLVGRFAISPASTLFDLALTSLAVRRVQLYLRVFAPYHPWLESAVIRAVDACAPPAP
jgi:hypothetical protein